MLRVSIVSDLAVFVLRLVGHEKDLFQTRPTKGKAKYKYNESIMQEWDKKILRR